jgi:hypothetical protein
MNGFPFDEIENILDDAEEDARINGWLKAYNNGLKRLDERAEAVSNFEFGAAHAIGEKKRDLRRACDRGARRRQWIREDEKRRIGEKQETIDPAKKKVIFRNGW